MILTSQATVLALDTLTDRLHVSLVHSGTIYQHSAPSIKHANIIREIIQRACQSAGIALEDVDILVVNVGPGAFTGLRIGLAYVRALAHALSIPVVALKHSELLAYGSYFFGSKPSDNPTSYFATLIDARLSQVYYSCYCIDGPGLLLQIAPDAIYDYSALPNADATKQHVLCCGDAWHSFLKQLPSTWHHHPISEIEHLDNDTRHFSLSSFGDEQLSGQRSRASIMLYIVIYLTSLDALETVAASELSPNYIRNQVAKKSSPKKPD